MPLTKNLSRLLGVPSVHEVEPTVEWQINGKKPAQQHIGGWHKYWITPQNFTKWMKK